MRMHPTFLIWAPNYSHRSSGVRALYRLCHHLNTAGYPSAMLADRGEPMPPWDAPLHAGPVGDSIVIYPEIVEGNPLGARRVVRWLLSAPRAGFFGADDMIFVYDPLQRERFARVLGTTLGPARVLWMGLVDPGCIYPDATVPRTIDCSFVHKGRALAERFALPHAGILPIETLTPTMAALGETLRRTRTLYSYDHYSNLLREAVISGCEVRTIDREGRWHDPRTCDCSPNILWHENLAGDYVRHFHDGRFVRGFVRELRTRWRVPGPAWRHRLRVLLGREGRGSPRPSPEIS